MDTFKQQRQQMLQEQIAARGVSDPRVLEAMSKVPREAFLDPSLAPLAYQDHPLPIEEDQTISQPFIVALMAELAQLKPQDRVLEIGTGSGYSAAVLSQMVFHVYSIERYPKLAAKAGECLQKLKYTNITLLVGDGTLGFKDFAPYDAIIVTACGPQTPPSLLEQLAIGGRLVIPIGSMVGHQELTRVKRKAEGDYVYENMGAVQFVPLVGTEGFIHD